MARRGRALPRHPEQDIALVPIAYGTLDDDGGAVACVQIAPLKYACSLGTATVSAVYYIDPADMSVHAVSGYTAAQEMFGDYEITTITFTSSPTEFPLRWSGSGIDVGNPAEQWKDLIERAGVGTDDDSFALAATAMDTRGINGAIVIAAVNETLRTAARDVGRSFNLQTFISRSGALGCTAAVPDTNPSSPVQVTESDTIASSWLMQHPGAYLTACTYEYSPRFGPARAYRAEGTFSDSGQLLRQSKRSSERIQMPYQRNAASASTVASDRIFFAREERVQVSLNVRPHIIRSLRIGSAVELTHSLGIGSGGFESVPMRAIGIGVEVNRERLTGRLMVVDTDFTVAPVTKEFFDYLPHARLPRMRSSAADFPLHRPQRRFDPSLD